MRSGDRGEDAEENQREESAGGRYDHALVNEMLREFTDGWIRCFYGGRACRGREGRLVLWTILHFGHREERSTERFMTVAATDQPLYQLVSGVAPATIDEVVQRMESIDELLPNGDGLKWFNRLYLMVTTEVDLSPPAGGWKNAEWLLLLDVVFAGFYFRAVADFLSGASTVPSSWSAMLSARYTAGIDRIQFALAGMNAHINHDLALALLATDQQMSIQPDYASPEHADYEAVNDLLNAVMPSALQMLAVGVLGELAQDTGKIGRILAFWNICRARDLAWGFADHLRGLDDGARQVALAAQDQLTGALGRAILVCP